LADRTIGRAFGTVSRLSVVCNVLYCGKTVRSSEKVSEGVNRKPGSKSSFLADRTIGRAFGTVSRLSVVCLSVRRL